MTKTLFLLLFAIVFFSQSAKADPVSLTINNGGSITSGGVYVGPYNFTSGGQSLQLVCDTFLNEVYPPETWTANTAPVGGGSGLFGSTSSAQYQQGAWLVQQMFANLGNTPAVADIQWALWDIFDPGTCTTACLIAIRMGTPATKAVSLGGSLLRRTRSTMQAATTQTL